MLLKIGTEIVIVEIIINFFNNTIMRYLLLTLITIVIVSVSCTKKAILQLPETSTSASNVLVEPETTSSDFRTCNEVEQLIPYGELSVYLTVHFGIGTIWLMVMTI